VIPVAFLSPIASLTMPFPRRRVVPSQAEPSLLRAPIKMDQVVFSGAAKPDVPPLVMAVDRATVSDQFFKRIEEATASVWESFSPPFQAALRSARYKVEVGKTMTEGVTCEELVPEDRLNDFLTLPMVQAQLTEYTPEQIQQMKKDILPVMIHLMTQGLPAYFLESRQVVRISEHTQGIYSLVWNRMKSDTDDMARIVRHETSHFVDTVFGKHNTGKRYSKDETYQQIAREEFNLAKAAGLLPKSDSYTPRGGQPYWYYLPYFETKPMEDKEFEELFAEVGASLYGGGILEVDFMEKVFPKTRAHVAGLINSLQPLPGAEALPQS
jgi:hypothetical protein